MTRLPLTMTNPPVTAANASEGSLAGPPAPSLAWHACEGLEGARRLGVDVERGLTAAEADQRRRSSGPNELQDRGMKSAWSVLGEQATATMVLILIGAAIVKAVAAIVTGQSREWIDAGAIGAIVLLNVVLGFVQEYRAERAIAALRRLAAPAVRVRRDGTTCTVPARELVPGDVVLLEAGATVPADGRVMTAAGLQVLEAALTGESAPVDKRTGPVPENTPLADRTNMVYLGTSVVRGRGAAIVVATGPHTEIGRIADLLQQVPTERTPLQRRIAQLGTALATAALLVITAMALLGVWRGASWLDMFLAGVAVAVAAIPEGLPAVLTITLALGAQRMLARGALIRRLPAVETLGSVTTICSDKTGTLTENRMQVVVLDVAGHELHVDEPMRSGYPLLLNRGESSESADDVAALLTIATLCNDAVLRPGVSAGSQIADGDPTEGAIIVAAAQQGLSKENLEQMLPRVSEVPFTSERQRMTTIHVADGSTSLPLPVHTLAHGASYLAAVKGSVEALLQRSHAVLEDGAMVAIEDRYQSRIRSAADRLAGRGLRVLGVAARPLSRLPDDLAEVESHLTFIGLIGLLDPPRPEVRAAVVECRQAGIRPVMITGDHPLTALEVARRLDIAGSDSHVVTGASLASANDAELSRMVADVAVFARVAPEDKLRIVQALQQRGHVVAMTGDGVNDAPALRKADIGVAMGTTGTDVAKEAADMVITDDNFATIVAAVREGRTIYDNVRKFVKYIVTSNSAEVSVMFLCQLAAMPMPMTTLQILWMNLVTDGVPGLALGLEPTEPGTMKRPPFEPQESIFSRGIRRHIVVMGLLLTATSFGVGWWAWSDNNPAWGTMVFVTLTLAQLGHAMAVRSHRESLFTLGLWSNPLLIGAVSVTLVLQLLVVYHPLAQGVFGTVALSVGELLICLVASTVIFWAVELEKWLGRRRSAA